MPGSNDSGPTLLVVSGDQHGEVDKTIQHNLPEFHLPLRIQHAGKQIPFTVVSEAYVLANNIERIGLRGPTLQSHSKMQQRMYAREGLQGYIVESDLPDVLGLDTLPYELTKPLGEVIGTCEVNIRWDKEWGLIIDVFSLNKRFVIPREYIIRLPEYRISFIRYDPLLQDCVQDEIVWENPLLVGDSPATGEI